MTIFLKFLSKIINEFEKNAYNDIQMLTIHNLQTFQNSYDLIKTLRSLEIEIILQLQEQKMQLEFRDKNAQKWPQWISNMRSLTIKS